jgi:hypothetical protein
MTDLQKLQAENIELRKDLAEQSRSLDAFRKDCDVRPLIIQGMTKEDFERFHEHHVPYSGSTGPDPDKNGYPEGSMLATFMSQFGRAIKALRWKDVSISIKGDDFIVKHAQHGCRPPR